MNQDVVKAINDRLTRLERQNRRLKACLLFLIMPLIVVFLGAAKERMADDVTANSVFTTGVHIRPEGAKGNRIFLGVDPNNNKAVINVWDATGKLVKAYGE